LITLSDMVTTQSITEPGAEQLRNIAVTGQSFLVYSRPRNAGKTTLANAILAEAPPNMPQLQFLGTPQEAASLSAHPNRGYLTVAEIGHRGQPGYLTGQEVVRLFELVTQGWSVASSLHADTVEEVFDVLGHNGIDVVTAGQVRYLIKVNPVGDPFDPATRRVVEEIHRVVPQNGLAPNTSLLYLRDDEEAATGHGHGAGQPIH
jgi:type IV secretory pathway ATPase VirB11/archaellum biosynthesis ATPase